MGETLRMLTQLLDWRKQPRHLARNHWHYLIRTSLLTLDVAVYDGELDMRKTHAERH